MASFGEETGLELVPASLLHPSVIERFVLVGCVGRSAATRRTPRTGMVRARRPERTIPVRTPYHERLLAAAAFAAERLVIGGTSPARRNVTSPLTASLSGGREIPRIDIARLRATWLCEVAETIGLRAFMDAAGITCSQRLGDLVSHLEPGAEEDAVALLAGRC